MRAITTFFILTLVILVGCKANEAQYEVIRTQGAMKFINIPSALSENTANYSSIVDAECRNGKICILHFFSDRSKVSFPMTDADLAAETAVFNRNPNTGLERLMLSCRLATADNSNCF